MDWLGNDVSATETVLLEDCRAVTVLFILLMLADE